MSQYPAPPAVPAAQPVAARGPLGKLRSPGISILLTIVTLGIYTYVWVWKTHEEMKRYSGNGFGGAVGFVIYFIFSPLTWFFIPNEIKALYESEGQPSPVSPMLGLWILLPIVGAFIWFLKVQGALNRFWEAHGAVKA